MKKRCVISLANERGNYRNALDRLHDSLLRYSDADIKLFRSENEIEAPSHLENPYAFKVFAFRKARQMGYDQVLWLDSSVYAIKPIDRIFSLIDGDGYVMQEAGHWVGEWCNDETLKYFGITRDQAMRMPMYGNAGLLGLDFTTSIAKLFFVAWTHAMNDGMFKGSWENHRHDMTCGSIIANLLNMKYQPGDQLLQYAAPGDKPINNSIVLYAQGL